MMEGAPTRSALLEHREERQVMGEGFRFLDEKRMLLAAEMMVQLERYRALRVEFTELHRQAAAALAAAVTRHGLGAVTIYPATPATAASLQVAERNFFGVKLATPVYSAPLGGEPLPPPANRSPEITICRNHFSKLSELGATLAALSGNLHRLLSEYRRTERRARALEEVILPELEATICEMTNRLEELDQEEGVRVRLRRVAG